MNTPIRTIRLADDLWEAIEKEAKRQGKTKSDIMREILIKDLLWKK